MPGGGLVPGAYIPKVTILIKREIGCKMTRKKIEAQEIRLGTIKERSRKRVQADHRMGKLT